MGQVQQQPDSSALTTRNAQVLSAIFAVVAAAALVGAYLLHLARKELIQATGESLAVAAASLADKLDLYLFERQGDLITLSGYPAFLGNDAAEMTLRLEGVRKAYRLYSWIAFADGRGRVVAATQPELVGSQRENAEWFRLAQNGTGVLVRSVDTTSKHTPGAAVLLATAVRATNGTPAGVLVAEARLPDPEYLVGSVSRALAARHGADTPFVWQIIASDGRIVFDSAGTSTDAPGQLASEQPSAKALRSGSPGFVEETDARTGDAVITGYAATRGAPFYGGPGWGVRVAFERASVLTPVHYALLLLTVGGVAVLLPLAGFAAWSTRRLRQDWQHMNAHEQRVEREYAGLRELARAPALRADDTEAALQALAEVCSDALRVQRVSFWYYARNRGTLHCVELFEADKRKHSYGTVLQAAEFPAYFRALTEGSAVVAADARTHPATQEFRDSYLDPLGITAMLDVPIFSEKRLIGVLCHEHIGGTREWALDEQNFAGSIADLGARQYEGWKRRRAETALRQAHDSLEAKVAERTSELAEANERLKEVDRLKSEFLATMSHELRTPLNSIIGFTGILRQGLAGPLTEEQAKQLGLVQGSARHLHTLINDLLDLSRIESGRMEVYHERFRVADVVREVVETLAPMVAQKGLALDTKLDSPSLEIVCDRKKTFQILLNLANNAVKFTEQGQVTIRVGERGQYLHVAVTDTGIGIKPQHMAGLFEAFRQIDGSARRVYEGTGLGLHLCRKLITLLGGEVRAESEFGVGSTFSFTLPRMPQPTL